MSLDEINQAIRDKCAVRDAVIAELKQLTQERNELEADQTAEDMLAGMSEIQRDALVAQIIRPSGIVNNSTFGPESR